MKDTVFIIEENRHLTESVLQMTLKGDTSDIAAPGQFVNLRLEGLYLRRPISVCDLNGDRLTLVYKIIGKGTAQMSTIAMGESVNVLTGLGNGFDLTKSGDSPLLVGGGVGVPPLYLLAKRLADQGKSPKIILGFNTKEDVFYEDEFKALGVKTLVTTADGSHGIKGFATDAFKLAGTYSYTYSCGPEPMLKAVYYTSETDGQYSFEERMGCGFGACMACSCKTKYGTKRICREGPVLEKGEIIW